MSTLFIFRVNFGLTDRWHSAGDCLVTADTEEQARSVVPEFLSEPETDEDEERIVLVGSLTLATKFEGPRLVRVSPDAGCC